MKNCERCCGQFPDSDSYFPFSFVIGCTCRSNYIIPADLPDDPDQNSELPGQAMVEEITEEAGKSYNEGDRKPDEAGGEENDKDLGQDIVSPASYAP